MRSLMLLAAVAAAAPVAAQTPAVRADTNERLICRSVQHIGSRLGARRSCKTQAQWDELEQATRNGVRDAQHRQVSPTVDWVPGQQNGLGPRDPR
jgi:hypothetical protein